MGAGQQAPLNPAVPGPLLNECGQCCLLRRGQLRWAAWWLFVRCALEPIAAEGADPCRAGLLVHASDQGHLCTALTGQNREDGEEICALAQVAQVLGRLQLAFHFFTI